MSLARTPEPGDDITDPPAFDLEFAFDDQADPSEVTVFPGRDSAGLLRRWITVDADAAISIEEAR